MESHKFLITLKRIFLQQSTYNLLEALGLIPLLNKKRGGERILSSRIDIFKAEPPFCLTFFCPNHCLQGKSPLDVLSHNMNMSHFGDNS